MFGNYIWPFIVSSMLATCNALQQGSPSGLGIEPFSAMETLLTPNSYAKVQHSSTKIMISTGSYPSPTKTTEVIDLEDSNVMCEDLEDFPMELEAAVGANLASTPIICGGYFGGTGSVHSSDKCFKYMEEGWQHFATMIERRDYASGIVYNKTFHILGGYDFDTKTKLQSSEIVKEDGSSTEGPQLPTPIMFHAIASINSTVSIISGGQTNMISDKTWYFNHASQEFQPGPNLLEARELHSSGSVTDQETKEKMAIIAGGYLDSTEMLLNGKWVTGKTYTKSELSIFCIPLASLKAIIKLSSFLELGPPLPKALWDSSMVELGENLYIIGGNSNDGSGHQREIHQLSCFSGLCSWTTLTQQLKVARTRPVALSIDNLYCA